MLNNRRCNHADEVERSLVSLDIVTWLAPTTQYVAVLLTIAVTLDCLKANSVSTARILNISSSACLGRELTVVDLDGTVNVKSDLQVLEGVQDGVVDIELLATVSTNHIRIDFKCKLCQL